MIPPLWTQLRLFKSSLQACSNLACCSIILPALVMGGPNYCGGIHPSRGGGPCVLGAGGHSCSIKGNLSRIAVTMIFNIFVPCVRSCTPALPKKHYKTRCFLSFLLSQTPLSKPGPHPRTPSRQGWEPIGLNFLGMVPI